nr:BTAD domain-containing putative transcriptional regulator [Allobranchiibius huperziae]
MAHLVAAGGEGVGATRLEEWLWPDDAPADPRKALQVIVSRARKQTAPDVIERVGTRYRCGLEPDQVDAWRLQHLARSARRAAAAQEWAAARDTAEQVLAIDVGDTEPGPLGDLRRSARDDVDSCRAVLGEAASRLGDHARAVPILQPLVTGPTPAEPLFEAYLRSLSETAGTAEALARYDAYRRALADELGTTPGDRLRALHAELLALEDPQRSGVRYDDTDLIGRAADVSALRESTRTARVVTILGPGGLGKTRLAHVIARGASQPAVHFVELAGVVSGDGVLPTLASAVGVRDSTTNRPVRPRPTDLRTRLIDRLGSVPTLLVLDNCEQVVDAVADLVAALITQVQALTVLTTSRTALGIRAERVYALPQLGHDDATTLFRDRALAARPGVELRDEVVGPLVDRLDGLPLAIELAAARVRAMSVTAIAERLDQRFSLLRGSTRGVPERHQTLQAVIDWSWNLLDADDRDALTALSAFHDGFDLEGAEWVVGSAALTHVESLVSQSLLTVVEDDTVRYRMLETVREFGRDRLEQTGRGTTVRGAVRAWALHVSRTTAARFFGPDQIDTIDALTRDEGNLAVELDRAIASDDAEATAVIGATLITLWQVSGNFLRAFDASESAAQVIMRHPVAPQDADAARTLLAWDAMFQGLFREAADQALLDALDTLGPGDDSRLAALVQISGVLAQVTGDHAATAEERLIALSGSPDRHLAGLAARWWMHLAENAGDLDVALHALDLALSNSEESDGPWQVHALRAERAGLLVQGGRRIEAAREAERAIDVLLRLHAVDDAAQQRMVIALGAIDAGDLAEAQSQAERLEAETAEVGVVGWGSSEPVRAELAFARGDRQSAARLHLDGWCLMQRLTVSLAMSLDRAAPWLLFGRAAYLHSVVLADTAGAPDAASTTAYVESLEALSETLAGSLADLDHPSAGALAFAVGRWVVTHLPDAADTGARLMVLAHASGYNQVYPSMDWERAVRDVQQVAPDLIDRARPGIGDDSAARFTQLRETVDRLRSAQSLRR